MWERKKNNKRTTTWGLEPRTPAMASSGLFLLTRPCRSSRFKSQIVVHLLFPPSPFSRLKCCVYYYSNVNHRTIVSFLCDTFVASHLKKKMGWHLVSLVIYKYLRTKNRSIRRSFMSKLKKKKRTQLWSVDENSLGSAKVSSNSPEV